MKIIENGIEREMTIEEQAIEKRINEEDVKLFNPQNSRDYMEEFIDRLAEIDRATDILKLAKEIKAKKVGNK